MQNISKSRFAALELNRLDGFVKELAAAKASAKPSSRRIAELRDEIDVIRRQTDNPDLSWEALRVLTA